MSKINRYTNSELDEILGQSFPVLDKGFIRVIDYMGSDSAVVQAARISYGDGTKSINQDRGLINYLMKHRHTSPFEMCEIKFHIKCPIFIARQWVRHRTANINEYSARYSILPEEFYCPSAETMSFQSTENMQGRGDRVSEDVANSAIADIKKSSEESFKAYKVLYEDKEISREIARSVLPLSAYTEFYWKIDLHNLLHFLFLRADKHAQYEIQEYAKCMLNIVKRWTPLCYDAFMAYRVDSKTFSKSQIDIIKKLIQKGGSGISYSSDLGLSEREFNEVISEILGD